MNLDEFEEEGSSGHRGWCDSRRPDLCESCIKEEAREEFEKKLIKLARAAKAHYDEPGWEKPKERSHALIDSIDEVFGDDA